MKSYDLFLCSLSEQFYQQLIVHSLYYSPVRHSEEMDLKTIPPSY